MLQRAGIFAAAAVALAFVAAASAAVSPYMWTPAYTAKRVIAQSASSDMGAYESARCAGRGTHVGIRYGAFRCVAHMPERAGIRAHDVTIWAKVARYGKSGRLCTSPTSLASVPAACLRP